MKHLYIFFQAINLILCFSLILLLSFSFYKKRYSYLKNYIFYLLSFFITIGVRLVIIYIKTNINNYNNGVILFLQFISLISVLSIFYFHQRTFFEFISKKIEIIFDFLFYTLAIISIIFDIYFLFKKDSNFMSYIVFITLFVYYLSVIIHFIIYLLNLKIINDQKKIILNVLYPTFIVFFPFLIYDNIKYFLSDFVNIEIKYFYFQSIFIFLFLIVNNLIVLLFLKRILDEIEKEKITISEEFIKNFNITNREKEIIDLIIEGKNNSEITDVLFISLSTVKTHINNIFKKIGINNRNKLLENLRKYQ